MPELIVIAGPNGSVKTTLSAYLLSKGRTKTSIINPDEIAKQELGSYSQQTRAARLALSRRDAALNSNDDFAFETTFSGNTEISLLQKAKTKGYKIILYYVALQTVIDNLTRVEERRLQSGHDVPKEDIIRRYTNSLTNLLENLHLFNKAYLFDNSGSQRSRVAMFDSGKLIWLNNKHKNHPFYKDLL